MIKNKAARTAAAVIIVAGVVAAPLLDDGRATDNTQASAVQAVLPQFSIHWRRNEIVLAGHTVSEQHERDLTAVAASQYPNVRVNSDFEPLGIVPSYWADLSVRTLYLLAASRAAEATISTAGVSIHGVIDDELAWKNRLAAFESTLPGQLSVAADMLFVSSDASESEICARALGAFSPGRIEFEESGVALRSSAYPRLDRVIALADTCLQFRILVTGHTDSSGTAALNNDLSLRRAETVADYIVAGGIDRERLLVSGAGSTVAVADNSTRHGRSLNRRIEIIFELP